MVSSSYHSIFRYLSFTTLRVLDLGNVFVFLWQNLDEGAHSAARRGGEVVVAFETPLPGGTSVPVPHRLPGGRGAQPAPLMSSFSLVHIFLNNFVSCSCLILLDCSSLFYL